MRLSWMILLLTLFMPSLAYSQTREGSFVPEEVFAGRSEGQGMLTLLGTTRRFTVESLGTSEGEGHMRLEQTVRLQGRAATSRTWVMRQVSPGRFAATLTDAAGPVSGRTEGSQLTLRYPLKRWGLVMHQTLTLSKDGRTVDNQGSIRFMGMQIGRLQETIQLIR